MRVIEPSFINFLIVGLLVTLWKLLWATLAARFPDSKIVTTLAAY